jgi:uncharacterized protein
VSDGFSESSASCRLRTVKRREFLIAAPLAAYGLTRTAPKNELTKLDPFDYEAVRLLPSRWQSQVQSGREFYFGIEDDDILHGFRAAADRKAPGKPLGGWCGIDSSTVFGQWLSGMSRLSRATSDSALRDKAVSLFEAWVETLPPDGNARMGHYRFDKLVGGLVDLARYAGQSSAEDVLSRVTANAMKTLERPENPREALADPSHNQRYYGVPQEWYTLSENLYRAHSLTSDPMFRGFAEEWHYHAYWAKFRSAASPLDAHGVHAYSHVNTFSSAAAAYEATGDPSYLATIKNAVEYLQRHQSFATGGYGPNERFMAKGGSLGKSLETRSDTFETSCGSWAAFKLSRYLLRFTGEARYGDWIERLLYNGVGAALPIRDDGRSFYYADYRLGGGMKVYNWDTYTCCSGTYLQNLAEYHNLIYFKDADGLFVNLFLPSEVKWNGVTLTQETRYPDADTTTFTVAADRPKAFSLRFRTPAWSRGILARINGEEARVDEAPGSWASLHRTWSPGDRVEVRIPLTLRMEPVDGNHPNRVAVVRGPAVFVLEGAYHDPAFALPMNDDELETWLVPEEGSLARGIWSTGLPEGEYPTCLRVAPPDGRSVRLRMRPFYEVGENYPYFMYFDRDELPWRLW